MSLVRTRGEAALGGPFPQGVIALRNLLSRVARLGACAAVLSGLLAIATPSADASAPPFTVTLEAEKTSAAPNETIQLHATANQRIDQPYYFQIWNETLGVKEGSCTNSSNCYVYAAYETGSYQFVAYITYNTYTAKTNIQAVSNPVVVNWAPLGGGIADDSWPSQSCEQTPGHLSVLEDFNFEGSNFDLTATSSTTEAHVCFRADAGSVHVGGRLNILTGGLPSVTGISVGVPFTDPNTSPCGGAAPNSVPGQHPMISGLVGGQLLVLDSYASTAWGASVCLSYGDTKIRVVVPFVIGSPVVDPGVIIPTLDLDPAA